MKSVTLEKIGQPAESPGAISTISLRVLTIGCILCGALWASVTHSAVPVEDDLAPLVDPPRAAAPVEDVLAPLEIPAAPDPEDSEDADPSQLTGYQIRPPSASVKVGRSLPLLARYCFEVIDGSSTYIECNPKAPSLPQILKPFSVSNWSVNGIRGGNAVVGRIAAQGNRATYTAPATVPEPATVAVSVEVPSEEGAKSLAVANVTIVDGVIYRSLVRFNGRREEQGEIIEYAGSAALTYQHADSFAGGIRYDLDSDDSQTRVTFEKWHITRDSTQCNLKGRVTRTGSYAPFPPPANLFIYSALHSYVFGALLEAAGIVVCTDGEETSEEEVDLRVLVNTSSGERDPGLQPLADAERLAGTSTLNLQLDEDGEDALIQTTEWEIYRD